jgi:hypothetical protein
MHILRPTSQDGEINDTNLTVPTFLTLDWKVVSMSPAISLDVALSNASNSLVADGCKFVEDNRR